MKCRNCGKTIDEFEIFCEDCKKELKAVSSKQEVNELEKLIEDQNELNKLEETKELNNLNDLVDERLNIEASDNKEEFTQELEKPTTRVEKLENLENKNNKKSKKTLIIVLSIIGVLLIAITVFLVILFNKPKEQVQEEKIDYEIVIKEYGKSIENVVKTYLKEHEEVPNWQQVTELNKYNKYDVVCNTHNIYTDGSIYLNECFVNDNKVEYSYGEEKEEVKEGIKLNVYKVSYNEEFYSYSHKNEPGSTLAGTITCKTDDCNYLYAYDKYVIVEENNENYLYNYETDTMEFGPFSLSEDFEFKNILSKNYVLYGIYYNDNGVNNLYNVNTGKILKNLKGTLYSNGFYNPGIVLYDYNYVILSNNGKNDFVNLKTGNVSYSIPGNIGNIIEDKNNKIVYMMVYDNTSYDGFKIYNSNGKLLFDGKTFKDFKLNNNSLFVSTNTNFKVYDSKLNLKFTSRNYNDVLGIYDDFIVVIDQGKLEIVDLDDKILATFDLEWDSDRYYFHNMLSGWYTENGKNGIYLVVEDKNTPYGNMGSGLEYYYIPDSKEIGVIETTGVGGYAKPVLYLYPNEKTDITVKFEHSDLLTTTYPKFKDKWQVTAYPNGDLYDLNGNYYYALYWEEEKNHSVDFNEGFYVTKNNAINFLEEKLSIIGLNAKERNEFIMYWLPILEKNEKSLVYFELTNERDYYNKLIISPKPDSILRVAMHVKKVNKKTSIKEQSLTSFDRNGFTAVEWGGVIY